MADEGSKRVEIVGADDKRQITSVFAITPLGDFLAPQLIYQGTTTKCLPNVRFHMVLISPVQKTTGRMKAQWSAT